MHSATRRDVWIVFCCAVVLIFLIEFRYDFTTRVLVLQPPDSGRSSTPTPPPSPLGAPIDDDSLSDANDGPQLDEYGEPIDAVSSLPPARRPHHHHHKGDTGPVHGHGRGRHRHGNALGASSAALGAASAKATKERRVGEDKIVWGTGEMPYTTLVRHAPGYTIFDNLYMRNGTFYLVKSDTRPTPFPDIRMMISNGAAMGAHDREPTEEHMKVITATEARRLFGEHASRVDGTSFVCYDHGEFFSHYYHFSAEILFGLWRTYSSLDLAVLPSGRTNLEPPRRLIAPHIAEEKWRDYAKMNQYVLRATFPSAGLELRHRWEDRVETMRTFYFDRVVLGDRAAASRGEDPRNVEKMTFHADKLPKSPHWWNPMRNNVLAFSGVDKTAKSKPVITYVTRQKWGRRMLARADDDKLVAGLQGLRKKYGWEVNIVSMEELTRDEQIRLAARTTPQLREMTGSLRQILMGVHGNGLTALLWMQPEPRTTVMEFFAPNGLVEDYKLTARMLGIKHYAFWNDRYVTFPDVPSKADLPAHGMPETFHSNDIPINADLVIKLCIERLTTPSP
ncbi:hypothetical protein FRB99_003028 [Tulasnella sp. 403]|nr:hypothetical protein FRB99_003028 [Tulasnella sp. 403]